MTTNKILPLYADNNVVMATITVKADDTDPAGFGTEALFQVVCGDHAVVLDFSYFEDQEGLEEAIKAEQEAVARLASAVMQFTLAFEERAAQVLAACKQA